MILTIFAISTEISDITIPNIKQIVKNKKKLSFPIHVKFHLPMFAIII